MPLSAWDSLEDNSAQVAALESELSRELSVGHPLFGLPVRAIYQARGNDDVLFTIDDGSGRVTVVHLTWKQSGPEVAPWPHAVIWDSFDAWSTAESDDAQMS